jgi:adenylate cyclase
LLSNAYKFARRMSIDKRRIRHIQFTLSQYLPNDAAAKLSKSVTVLEQQRQLVYGVCLMTDIQGYTRLAETLAPDELHQLMNVYYSELVSAVEAHGGFIGNLVGDGMLALWTGPEITPLMCQQALLASQEIQQRINNNVLLKQQLPTCSALHGGQFSLGNLGAKGHFEYSPVGDIINTASRVEHFNRNLGTQFLCTETIAKQLMLLPNPIALRLLGHFTFRHKSMAMALYGLAQGLSEELLNTYEQALSAYTQADFAFAKQHFEQLFNLYQDGPSQYYLDELNKESSNDSAIQN